MDSSGLQRSNSISSNLGCEKAAMVQSKRAEIFTRYQRQEFSLPDSIICYIAKNPTSPELYQKMVQICKFFFVKNPILVISALNYLRDGKWNLSSIKSQPDVSKIVSKIWITNELYIYPGDSVNKKAVNQNILSSLIPKLYKCDAKSVTIGNQTISFCDLSFLISAATWIEFKNITVKNEDGSNVALEKLLKFLSKQNGFNCNMSKKFLSNITSETMKELLKLPHFSKLNELSLYGIPEAFDLETFHSYMKKNIITKIWLRFDDSISAAYKNRLEEIVDEILATKTPDYKPPFIQFNGLDEKKRRKSC